MELIRDTNFLMGVGYGVSFVLAVWVINHVIYLNRIRQNSRQIHSLSVKLRNEGYSACITFPMKKYLHYIGNFNDQEAAILGKANALIFSKEGYLVNARVSVPGVSGIRKMHLKLVDESDIEEI